jgi:hypothetical protein
MSPTVKRLLLMGRGEFDPRTIAGLGLWLRADSTLSAISPDVPASDGQSVSRWLDKSGNSRHYDQEIGGSQPTFSSTGLGGRPCASFDGLDDQCTSTVGMDILQNVAGATLFCVGSPSAATVSTRTALMTVGTDSTSARASVFYEPTDDYGAGGRRSDGNNFVFLQDGAYTRPSIVTGVFDYANALLSLYGNGALVGGPSAFQTAGNTSNTASARCRLGAATAASPNLLMAGLIAEALVWPRNLTASEIAYVHRYLGRRYNIAVP